MTRYYSHLRSRGFSFIELLFVITIMMILMTLGAISYRAVQERSRDGKRKSDLAQIQSALEMYRSQSSNNTYPADIPEECSGSGGITDGSNTYLATVPHDPRCATFTYYYYPFSNDDASCGGSAPCACDGVSILCDDYTLAAYLESENQGNVCGGAPMSYNCGPNVDCNYCLGPYGDTSY